MTEFFDRNGKRMSLLEWAEAFEDMGYRVLGSHTVEHLWVSTVWMGFDLDPINWFVDDPGPPMIFESMIFVIPQGDDNWTSLEQRRYRTEHDAMVGHAELVHMVNLMADVAKEVIDDELEERGDLRPVLGNGRTGSDSGETPGPDA